MIGWRIARRFSQQLRWMGERHLQDQYAQTGQVDPEQLSMLAVRAVWASWAVNKIDSFKFEELPSREIIPGTATDKEGQGSDHLKKIPKFPKSLRQTLVDQKSHESQLVDYLTENDLWFEHHQQAASQILDFFRYGKGQAISSKLRQEQGRIKGSLNYGKKLTYNPTTLITQQVFGFRKIEVYFPAIHTGSYGTGKTISWILQSQLFKVISLYRFLGHKTSLLSELINKDHILQQRRLLYWSLKETQGVSELRSHLRAEFPELSKKLQGQQKTPKQLLFSVRQEYWAKGDIELTPLIDQINAYYSLARQIQALKVKVNTEQDQNRLSRLQKEQRDLYESLYLITKLFPDTWFNSSLSLEQNLVDFKNQKEYFHLTHKQQFDYRQIKYRQRLMTQEGQMDFCHVIWFEFFRHMESQLPELQSYRDTALWLLYDMRPWPVWVRSLSVNHVMTQFKQSNVQQWRTQNKLDWLHQKLKDLGQQIKDHSVQTFKENLNSWLLKGSQQFQKQKVQAFLSLNDKVISYRNELQLENAKKAQQLGKNLTYQSSQQPLTMTFEQSEPKGSPSDLVGSFQKLTYNPSYSEGQFFKIVKDPSDSSKSQLIVFLSPSDFIKYASKMVFSTVLVPTRRLLLPKNISLSRLGSIMDYVFAQILADKQTELRFLEGSSSLNVIKEQSTQIRSFHSIRVQNPEFVQRITQPFKEILSNPKKFLICLPFSSTDYLLLTRSKNELFNLQTLGIDDTNGVFDVMNMRMTSGGNKGDTLRMMFIDWTVGEADLTYAHAKIYKFYKWIWRQKHKLQDLIKPHPFADKIHLELDYVIACMPKVKQGLSSGQQGTIIQDYVNHQISQEKKKELKKQQDKNQKILQKNNSKRQVTAAATSQKKSESESQVTALTPPKLSDVRWLEQEGVFTLQDTERCTISVGLANILKLDLVVDLQIPQKKEMYDMFKHYLQFLQERSQTELQKKRELELLHKKTKQLERRLAQMKKQSEKLKEHNGNNE